MDSSTVSAMWTGPFPAEMPDGRTLQVGEQCDIPLEHLESGHWQAADGTTTFTPPAPADEPEPQTTEVAVQVEPPASVEVHVEPEQAV